MAGRPNTSPEVRLPLPPPPPPRDRLPAQPEIRVPAREIVQMHTTPEVRERAPQPTPAVVLSSSDPTTRRRPSNRELLRQALSTQSATRQAFLLREVLGPPVSLRRH